MKTKEVRQHFIKTLVRFMYVCLLFTNIILKKLDINKYFNWLQQDLNPQPLSSWTMHEYWTIQPNCPNDRHISVWCIWPCLDLIVCSDHVTFAFESESTHYIILSVTVLFPPNKYNYNCIALFVKLENDNIK